MACTRTNSQQSRTLFQLIYIPNCALHDITELFVCRLGRTRCNSQADHIVGQVPLLSGEICEHYLDGPTRVSSVLERTKPVVFWMVVRGKMDVGEMNVVHQSMLMVMCSPRRCSVNLFAPPSHSTSRTVPWSPTSRRMFVLRSCHISPSCMSFILNIGLSLSFTGVSLLSRMRRANPFLLIIRRMVLRRGT